MDTFVVICRVSREETPREPLDFSEDAKPYVLATRQVFASHEDARLYAAGVAASREPLVIPGDWLHLRSPVIFDEREVRS